MKPTSVLFVCLGNICRSPMAEGIFKKILENQQLTSEIQVDSAGMIDFHQGLLADERMRYHAEKRDYHLTHLSRPFSISDFDKFDMIIGMDEQNIRALHNKTRNASDSNKIYRMTDFCQRLEADFIPDPYYGGSQGFENVIDLLEDACEGLFYNKFNY